MIYRIYNKKFDQVAVITKDEPLTGLMGLWAGYASPLTCLLDPWKEPEHPDYIPF